MMQTTDFQTLSHEFNNRLEIKMRYEIIADVITQTTLLKNEKYVIYDSRYNSLEKRYHMHNKIWTYKIDSSSLKNMVAKDQQYFKSKGIYVQLNPRCVGKRPSEVSDSTVLLLLFDRSGKVLSQVRKDGSLDCNFEDRIVPKI